MEKNKKENNTNKDIKSKKKNYKLWFRFSLNEPVTPNIFHSSKKNTQYDTSPTSIDRYASGK